MEKTCWTVVARPTKREPVESLQRGGGAMEKVTMKGQWTKLSLCPSPSEQANQICSGDAAWWSSCCFDGVPHHVVMTWIHCGAPLHHLHSSLIYLQQTIFSLTIKPLNKPNPRNKLPTFPDISYEVFWNLPPPHPAKGNREQRPCFLNTCVGDAETLLKHTQ